MPRAWKFALALAALFAALAPAQTIIDMGALPSQTVTSRAYGVNADGTVVVGTSDNRAVRWTLAGGLQNLGALPGTAGGTAWGVSADGQTVGGTADPRYGFRWTPAGGMQSLGLPYPGSNLVDCLGVSANGQVFFGQGRWPDNDYAYRWTVAGGYQQLAGIGNGGGIAWDASPTGGYLCGQSGVNGNPRAVRWSPNGSLTNIGAEVSLNYSYAYGISDDGMVVAGILSYFGNLNDYIGFIWRDLGNGNTQPELIFPPQGSSQCYIHELSPTGTVCVGSTLSANGFRAHVWTTDGDWRDLNNWLGLLGVDTTGWVLRECFDISADGRTLVGRGTHNGVERGFIVRDMPCMHRPTILTQPPENTSACGGDHVELTTAAGGTYTGTIEYVWSRNSVILSANGITPWGSFISGYNAPTLNIYNARPEDSGEYICYVYNDCGLLTTSVANLYVTAPTIEAQTEDYAVCANSEAVLSVIASSEFLLSYQWLYREQDWMLWTHVSNGTTGMGSVISGAQSSLLIISNSQQDIQGHYLCQVTGCGYTDSASAYVAVLFSAPAVVNDPQDTEICPDHSATFTVTAAIPNSAPHAYYQWERHIPPNFYTTLSNGPTTTWDGNQPGIGGIVSGANTPTLTIQPDLANGRVLAESAHAGNYRCRIFNNCGTVFSQPGTLKVFISCTTADLNGDNVVNNFDIDPFVLALTNPAAFELAYPLVNPENADVNGDGTVNNFDIDPFVECLITGCE